MFFIVLQQTYSILVASMLGRFATRLLLTCQISSSSSTESYRPCCRPRDRGTLEDGKRDPRPRALAQVPRQDELRRPSPEVRSRAQPAPMPMVGGGQNGGCHEELLAHIFCTCEKTHANMSKAGSVLPITAIAAQNDHD